MAIHDNFGALSCGQVISATSLSQMYIDFNALADYGVGNHVPLYMTTLIRGSFSYDLRIQLLATTTKGDFSSPIVLNDSGVIPLADLEKGLEIPLVIPPKNVKYRSICARFIPSLHPTAFSASIVVTDDTGSGAVLTPTITSGKLTAVTVTDGGSGYSNDAEATLTANYGSGATMTLTIASGVITAVTVTEQGSGYAAPTTVDESTDTSGGSTYTRDENFNPPAKVGETVAAISNGLDCYVTHYFGSKVYYPHANDSGSSAG